MQTGKKEKNMGEKRVRNEMEGNEERRRIQKKEETKCNYSMIASV